MSHNSDLINDSYKKISEELKKGLYYSDVNELFKQIEVFPFNYIEIEEDEYNNIDILNESQIQIDKEIKTNKNYNNVIIFNLDKYLERIGKSFNWNEDRINCQFEMDFVRSQLFINNNRIYKKEKILDSLKKYSKNKIDILGNSFQLDKVILMLLTQASCAFMYIVMSQQYNDYEKGIYVTSNNIKFLLNTSTNINLIIKATFNIKNTNTNTNIEKLIVETNIDFILLNKTSSFKFNKYGIVSWNLA